MLLLGGAATAKALTGMCYKLAAFLIPWVSIRPSKIAIQAQMTRKKPSSFIWTSAALFVLFAGYFQVLAYEYRGDNQNVVKKELKGMKVK